MVFVPCLEFDGGRPREGCRITLGHGLLDDYVVFVAARARWNTVLAVAYDLKVAFTVLGADLCRSIIRFGFGQGLYRVVRLLVGL
jgi:integrase/recombinase XerD